MTKTVLVGHFVVGLMALAIIAAAFLFAPSITGFHIIPRNVTVAIDSLDEGRIGYFTYPSEIDQYSRMNISVEFINTGSTSYNARIEVYIQDFNVSTNYSRMLGGYSYVNPGGRIFFKTRYTPTNWGFQWVHVIAPYGENSTKKAEAWGLFYAKPYYYPWPPGEGGNETGGGGGSSSGGGGAGGGGGGGVGNIGAPAKGVPGQEYQQMIAEWPSSDAGVVGFDIEYPKRVSLKPGGSSVAYIVANNTGTMMLRNLMVTGYITGARMDINPKIVYRLPGKNSTVFMISLDAPRDLDPGIYFLEFRVSSNKANATGHIDIYVGEKELDDSLNQSLMNYEYLISRMEEEIEGLKLDGKNMTLASGYIEESKALLKKARDDYEKKDFEAVQDGLKRIRSLLIKTAAEIALAKSFGAFIALSPASLLIFIIIAIAIIAGIAVYTHKKRKERVLAERERELGNVNESVG